MSLNFETESETGFIRVSISRPSPRLKLSESQPRDRVRDHRIGQDRDRESRYTLTENQDQKHLLRCKAIERKLERHQLTKNRIEYENIY